MEELKEVKIWVKIEERCGCRKGETGNMYFPFPSENPDFSHIAETFQIFDGITLFSVE